jgi:A/G-specific adenine glycosylase
MPRVLTVSVSTSGSVLRSKNLKDSVSQPASAAKAASQTTLPFSVIGFRNRLHSWYSEHARDLPWRGINHPYATWLSEIMLQQTRVATVIDRYRQFLERFPTLRDLAEAEEAEVLALWSGLGYYRRARLLHRAAQFVLRELDGKLPRAAARLRTLPGVGDYTAAAIASIAFGESVAVVDGNVERVLLRVLGLQEVRSAVRRAELAHVAQQLVPPASRRTGGRNLNASGNHNQAMMELGATVCLPKAPLCLQCPVRDLCKTRGEHVTPPRERQQSRTVAHLLVLRKRGVGTEVLLERRSPAESLMPGMLELPPLPLESVGDREPVLRLRHAITNTNYYVQIFAESAPGRTPSANAGSDDHAADLPWRPIRLQPPSRQPSRESYAAAAPAFDLDPEDPAFDDAAVIIAEPGELEAESGLASPLLAAISGAAERLEWVPTTALIDRPLTGLARKSLQRLGVMAVPTLRIG